MSSADHRLIRLGVITGAHGIRGEVKIRSFTATPEDIAAYGDLQDASGKFYHLTVTGHHKDTLIARIHGITSRDVAEKLRNIELFVARSALPAPKSDEYYHADLIGLSVLTETGEIYGHVVGVNNFGAGDILEIHLVNGKEISMPFNNMTFPVIDIENQRLVILPPEMI